MIFSLKSKCSLRIYATCTGTRRSGWNRLTVRTRFFVLLVALVFLLYKTIYCPTCKLSMPLREGQWLSFLTTFSPPMNLPELRWLGTRVIYFCLFFTPVIYFDPVKLAMLLPESS